jgi:8-oxo-dGTP diphosphatase
MEDWRPLDRFKLISTVHLFFIRNGEVLLLRRFNTGYEDGNYSVPAGHMDGGESVKAAAIREGAEECAVSIRPQDLEVVGVMHRRAADERIDFFLGVHEWNGSISNAEPDKCDELDWYPLERLPVNTIAYVKHALENYQGGTWFMSYGWDGFD